MSRKSFPLTIAALLLTFCVPATAQKPVKIPLVGYLSTGDMASNSARVDSIRRALRALGYIEGRTIDFEFRYAEGKFDRHPALATELVRLNPAVIVVSGGAIPVRALKNATKTIPIVMFGVGTDPVKEGLVESLANPGGNITGLTLLSGDLGGKRLQLLQETVRKLVHVAVLYNPTVPVNIVASDFIDLARKLVVRF